MEVFDGKKFAEDLIILRGDMSQEEFARRLELNRSMIAMFEKGKQIPKIELLTRLARMTGKSPDAYFVETENHMQHSFPK